MKKRIKIWKWLEKIGPWIAYCHNEIKKDFEKKTGKKASWRTETIEEVNKTYGQPKRILEPIKGDPKKLVADGWRIAYGLWMRYCGKGDCHRFFGRGSTARCCIEELKKADL